MDVRSKSWENKEKLSDGAIDRRLAASVIESEMISAFEQHIIMLHSLNMKLFVLAKPLAANVV